MKKYLKKILIPMIIITITTSIVMLLNTIKQYKSFNEQINIKMAQIISEIKENYPEVDTNEIIEILNKDDASNIEGKELLKRYGMYSNEENSILTIKNQMNNNIRTNVAFVVIINLVLIIIAILYIKSRNKKLNEIKKYINEINNRNYELKIEDNSEDELSNLKNELYKITVMLKEEAEKSKQDKESLKVSVQDISHQLKTPITSIMGYADTLLEGEYDKETQAKFLNVIASEARRMARLVTDLLTLSRYDTNKNNVQREKFDLGELVKKCQDKLAIEIKKKKHNVDCFVTADVPYVYADKDDIERVILNILSNSIKYTPDNGDIKIYVGFVYNDAYIKVLDNGIGIPEEDLGRIFERFYRVDKARSREMGGTGLGLSIAKDLLDKNGGSIDIKSEVGKGTEVVMKIPTKISEAEI